MSDPPVPTELPPEIVRLILQQAPQALLRAFPDPGEGQGKAYRELPEHTREWIEGKSAKELDQLDAMLADYQAAKIIGRAGRWLAVAVASVFGGAYAMAKFGFDVWSWTKGGGR